MLKTDSRTALKNAIKHALEGGGETPQVDELMSNPRALSSLERSAWLQLKNWSADQSLRDQSTHFAQFSRRRLGQLLESLEG